MCRLFSRFSLTPQGIEDPLKEGKFSLLHLSTNDPKRRQSDGWGVGWIAQGMPRVMKSAGAIYRERSRVRRMAQMIFSPTLVGHIRRASNPLGLPKKALIGLPKCQPFTHGPWLFCHNGTLSIPLEVKAELGAWKKFVKSNNDSEVLFYWLLKTFVHSQAGTPAARLRQSMKRLDQLWRRRRAAHPNLKFPMHGLNWVLTNGKECYAFCYVNPQGFRQGGALGHKKQPYFALQWRATSDCIDIASEAWDSDARWTSLGHSTLLVAVRHKKVLRFKKYRI